MNTEHTTTKSKKPSYRTALSGALARRDQDTAKPSTRGKSYGSGSDESKKNKMKEYVTGKQQRGQWLRNDEINPRGTANASERSGFAHVGMGLTRTP